VQHNLVTCGAYLPFYDLTDYDTNHLNVTRANRKRLDESIAQLEAGNVTTFTLDELQAKVGSIHKH